MGAENSDPIFTGRLFRARGSRVRGRGRSAIRPWAVSALGAVPLLLAGDCQEYGVGSTEQVEEPVVVTEQFTQEPASQVDLLWVVDDTRSMAEEQEALASSFSTFVEDLEAHQVAYQLGVVTTDITSDEAGLLVGSPWIVTPSMDDPQALFAENVQVGTDGMDPEGGLGAAWLALTEPLRSGENRGFRREGSTLHVVVVSDADDQSEDLLGDDPASVFTAFLEEEARTGGGEARLSAVVGDPEGGCHGEGGDAQPGTRYAEVADASGGVVESICATDLGGVLESLAATSLVYTDTFVLQAEPVSGSISVTVDDERTGAWQYDATAQAVVFDASPEAGSIIVVRYTVVGGATADTAEGAAKGLGGQRW